jgi:hypothetical protein
LGEHEKIIYDIRQCPVGKMTLCVTSDAEYEKCIKMKVSGGGSAGELPLTFASFRRR